jgi:hypothetical protein
LSLAVLCNGSDALARNPRDVFNQFAGIPQSVVTKAVQAQWRKSPDAEITCVGQNLRPGERIAGVKRKWENVPKGLRKSVSKKESACVRGGD